MVTITSRDLENISIQLQAFQPRTVLRLYWTFSAKELNGNKLQGH